MLRVDDDGRVGSRGVGGVLGRLFRRPSPAYHRNGQQLDQERGYPPCAPPRRILVVKLFALGDMLNITPALRALRVRYPEARIDVLATRGGAVGLQRSPFVDDVFIFDKTLFDSVGGSLSPRALLVGLRFARDLRRRRYDTLVLLHHLVTAWGTIKYLALALWSGAGTRVGLDNGRGSFLTHRVRDRGFGAIDERRYWLAIVAALDARSDDDRPHFTVTATDRDAGARLLAELPGAGPIVAIHPTNGAYAAGRQWPPERFAAVADRLAREWGARIVLVGTETAAIGRVAALMAEPCLDLAGRTDLPTLAGTLGHAALLIGNDSSVAHLAAALDVPVLALFGPSNDRAWAPWGTARVVLPSDDAQLPTLPPTRGIVVRSAVPQAPCLYTGFGPGNPAGCPNCQCLALIDAGRVAHLAGSLLARAGYRPQVPATVV